MRTFKPYKNIGGKELDLRKELNRFMFGAADEIPKGQLNILRRMRRQEGIIFPVKSTDLLICDCKSESLQQEPDLDYPCDICDGEGYLFDDEIVACYRTTRYDIPDVEKYYAWGKSTINMSFFYIEFHEDVSRFDKIIEPVYTKQGNVSSPVKILHKHNIHMAEAFRSDIGRVEYYRLSCFTD